MKKVFFAGIALMLAVQGQAAAVLEEDFENAAYVIGNTVASAGILTLGIDTTTGGNTVMASTLGGTKSSSIVDGATTAASRVSYTNAALTALNGDQGVLQGSLQVDFKYGSGVGNWEIILVDDLQGGNAFTIANCVATIRGASNVLSVYTSGGDVTAPNPLSPNTDYRFKFSWDNATKKVTYEVRSNAPAYDTVAWDSGEVAFRSADTAIKGVRYLGFYTDQPYQGTNEVDNIIVTDGTAGPEPEVAVTVDSADVADGGSVNFGAPAVGVPTSKTFTVSNTGTVDLTTANLVLPAGYTLAAGSTLAATIAASATDDFIVELDTATAGKKEGQITFDTNDSDENPFNISVTANVGSTSVEEWTER